MTPEQTYRQLQSQRAEDRRQQRYQEKLDRYELRERVDAAPGKIQFSIMIGCLVFLFCLYVGLPALIALFPVLVGLLSVSDVFAFHAEQQQRSLTYRDALQRVKDYGQRKVTIDVWFATLQQYEIDEIKAIWIKAGEVGLARWYVGQWSKYQAYAETEVRETEEDKNAAMSLSLERIETVEKRLERLKREEKIEETKRNLGELTQKDLAGRALQLPE